MATLDFGGEQVVTFDGGRAVITSWADGLRIVDLATNEVTKTVKLPESNIVGTVVGDAVWVSNFDHDTVTRLKL